MEIPASPRSGYTLPVFACAAAIAALRAIHDPQAPAATAVDLIEPAETAEIPIEQAARLNAGTALAITRSDPGDNLDLTRNTPIWALVTSNWPTLLEGQSQTASASAQTAASPISPAQMLAVPLAAESNFAHPAEADLTEENQPSAIGSEPDPSAAIPAITILAGEGIGRQVNANDRAAIYAYAQRLLQENLQRQLKPGEKIQVTLILPAGRALAQRTSNAAFGVVEGLSLLGTSGIAQPLSAPAQLEIFRSALQQKAQQFKQVVFCLGENGLDLAAKLGIDRARTLKTANWLGPLLVEAGCQSIESILLFGYHGKLMKLAGGIFHTHHHVADGRLEILTAHCANAGLPTSDLQAILASSTAEAALQYLRRLSGGQGCNWVERVYGAIAQQIDRRASAYIQKHSEQYVQVGSILFDRDRQLIVTSQIGADLLPAVL